jgi:alpha-1,6-mannosyltransferase
VIVALYALYSSAGAHVLGFLPSYRTEEGFADGSGFWLLSGLSFFITMPAGAATVYVACAAIGLVALAAVVVRGRAPGHDVAVLCRDAGLLMAATMVVVSPHYPWYFAWLALPCAIAPSWTVLWLSAAPLLLYLDPWPHDRFIWPSLLYLPALALLGVDLWRHRISEGTLPCPARQL